jgi:hypothetical protein
MNTFLRAMFWVLIVVTCSTVIFCGYHVERPLAIEWPLESIAIWGSVAALVFAVGLFFAMPSTRNGRIGLIVGLGFLIFTAFSSFQTLGRTKFLYRSVDLAVNIESATGSTITVGGQLIEPVNQFELPVVLLMPDASPDSYARNIFYAKALARRGVAAVAYGRSAPTETSAIAVADLETRGADIIYMLDILEKRTELNMRRAGVLGFEENEWVVPYTAQKTNRVYFAALLAPSGQEPLERILFTIDQNLRAEGITDEDRDTAKALVTDLGVGLQTGDVSEKRAELIQRWDAAKGSAWFKAAGLPDTPPQTGSLSAAATSLSFQPVPLWTQVAIPVLILAGSEDPGSLPEFLRDRFTRYFEKNEAARWELKIVPGANHRMLLNADHYNSLNADFPPGYFDAIARWVSDSSQSGN